MFFEKKFLDTFLSTFLSTFLTPLHCATTGASQQLALVTPSGTASPTSATQPYAQMSQFGTFYGLQAQASASGGGLYLVRYPRGSEQHIISKKLEAAGVSLVEQGGASSHPSTNRVRGVQELAKISGVTEDNAVAAIADAATDAMQTQTQTQLV